MFLRTDKHCCTNTVWLYVCPLRTMVFIAINNEWLTRDPFREYEIKKEETTRSFLTKEEIRLLMDGKLKNAKHDSLQVELLAEFLAILIHTASQAQTTIIRVSGVRSS